MGVESATTYTVLCDYCNGTIAGPHWSLKEVVSLALARANHRYDRGRAAGDAWECYQCRAKRAVAEELRETAAGRAEGR